MLEIKPVKSAKSLNISKLQVTLERAEMFTLHYTIKGYSKEGVAQMLTLPLKVDLPFDEAHLKELALKELGLKELKESE